MWKKNFVNLKLSPYVKNSKGTKLDSEKQMSDRYYELLHYLYYFWILWKYVEIFTIGQNENILTKFDQTFTKDNFDLYRIF